MTINRRTQTRFDVDLPADLRIADRPETLVRIINLSLGGALLTGAELTMGQRVELTFRVPTGDEPITVTATVRWGSTREVGVQFDGLRAREVYALNNLFERLTASALG